MATVLIFVEDPGASNFIADLPEALAARGCTSRLLATGLAVSHLEGRGVACEVIAPTLTAADLLDMTEPRVVIVGTCENRDTIGHGLVVEARRRRVATLGVVDMQANSAFRFQGRTSSPLAYAPDRLVVPDELTKESYVALGFRPEDVVLCGNPHFAHLRDRRARLTVSDIQALRDDLFPEAGARQVVVFTMEPPNVLDPSAAGRTGSYALTGRGTSTERVAIAIEEFLDAAALLDERPYLVLRLHPRNTLDEVAPYAAEFDCVSNSGPIADLIFAADLFAGLTTTALMEAAVCGTPTLSIVPDPDEADWLPSVRSGVTPCVSSRAALRDVLPDVLRRTAHSRPVTLPAGGVVCLAETVLSMVDSSRAVGQR